MPTEAAVRGERLRSQRRLMGVWSSRSNTFVYPEFQFDESGRPRAELPELLAILPADEVSGGWREAFWLYSPHALLDGKSPAEVFSEDPKRIIDVARTEFSGNPDDHW